jgi:tripartite-type tricarboxylate transporter receptor subunit TctC
MRIRFHVTACLLAAAIIGAGTASDVLAQSFPSRRITLTVPFPAGSATDGVTRRLAESIHDQAGEWYWWRISRAQTATSPRYRS